MEGKFVIIIAVALFFISLVQLMKIYDLAAKVRGNKSQEKVTRGENMLMANLMLIFMVVFFGFIIWLIIKYGANAGLYKAASEHGEKLDSLLMLNWYIILPVFFFTNSLLFIFLGGITIEKSEKHFIIPIIINWNWYGQYYLLLL